MKLKIQRGYRELEIGEEIKPGDLFSDGSGWSQYHDSIGDAYKVTDHDLKGRPNYIGITNRMETNRMKTNIFKVGDRVRARYLSFDHCGTIVCLSDNSEFKGAVINFGRSVGEGCLKSSIQCFNYDFLTKVPDIKIGEYDVVREGDVLKVGCQVVTKKEFNQIKELMGW